MSRNLIIAALAVPVLALSLSAQTQSYFVPDNVATTGGCNVIPFGTSSLSTTWANQRYQTLATAADLGNSQVLTICDLAFAPCGTTSFIRHFDSIEIKLGQTTATTLNATFSANLVTNVQTVLACKNFDWHQDGGVWNRIGLQRDYLYLAAQGSTLVLEVTVTGAQHVAGTAGTQGMRTGASPRLYNFGWTGAVPTTGTVGTSAACKWEVVVQQNDLHKFGQGCKGTNGVPALDFTGSAALGSNLTIDLSNGPFSGITFLALGLTEICGGFDLGIMGAPGCSQFAALDILAALPTSATGTASVPATVPLNRSLLCLRIYAQYFPVDPVNSAGLTASNYGRIMAGY
jgi:hypothetical protein